jgi:hypothetical protein
MWYPKVSLSPLWFILWMLWMDYIFLSYRLKNGILVCTEPAGNEMLPCWPVWQSGGGSICSMPSATTTPAVTSLFWIYLRCIQSILLHGRIINLFCAWWWVTYWWAGFYTLQCWHRHDTMHWKTQQCQDGYPFLVQRRTCSTIDSWSHGEAVPSQRLWPCILSTRRFAILLSPI